MDHPTGTRVSSDTDLQPRPGVTVVDNGTFFSVYAAHAEAVYVCLFEAGDTAGVTERRVPLPHRTHGWWHGFVEGVGPGQRYNLRVDGPWSPHDGHRHNVNKLLIDPYAQALEGDVALTEEIYAHTVEAPEMTGDDEIRSGLDSRACVPRCVVVSDEFEWSIVPRPRHQLSSTVIYEVHVKDLTRLHPDVPEHLRGTYAGMAHPVVVHHLRRLGVTAVELLPVNALFSEPHLLREGLINHWGYNPLSYFAPNPAYAAATDPQGVVDEFKGMVKALHEAGIEVILDVVYNHTCEQGVDGACLSWRGIDAKTYYRLDERGVDVDVTGCGNTLDLSEPIVVQMVLDSLRHWVQAYHVDGFRFDLAVALARGPQHDYDPHHPFLTALRSDPVLSRVKLIAEPWDLGIHGWRTGQFPPPFSEWNDRFRDGTRAFWLTDLNLAHRGESHFGHGVRDVATRLAGSEDIFGANDRGATASINFITAHDGFSLTDLVSYDHKHNEANREGNRDGTNSNRSWNHGLEGPTDTRAVNLLRRRSMRNLLATLLFSTGVPMITAGDEMGHTRQGNNNPYCQDNEITWLNWDLEKWQRDLLETARFLVQLRREYPALRQQHFFRGEPVNSDGTADITWYDVHGHVMQPHRWSDPSTRTLQMFVNGARSHHRSMLLVLHGGSGARDVTLPSPAGVRGYRLLWDSMWNRPGDPGSVNPPGIVTIGASSVRVHLAVDEP
ncbi:glycogen debranching protein GlgX [Kribbia dieselivorans]|uniref:glycogen debranching protein GlgX n=1 Tax=Kribbia dieselivorans TaxID=331526 RepID=UPI000838B072|nr:glycogen debranching protein GlgX [Kribbia dieselivorans]